NREKINFFKSNYLTCHVKQKNSLRKIKLFQDIKTLSVISTKKELFCKSLRKLLMGYGHRQPVRLTQNM
ncbi:hypothetical protein BpHYR1_012568, partial [Brachionus plicatilis]